MLLRSFIALLATGAVVEAVPSVDEAKTDKGVELVIVYAMRHIHKLCDRLAGFAASQKTVDVGTAFTAVVRDL